MNPAVDTPCCSDLELDQLLLGELDDDHAARLRTHLATSPRCQARLAALETVQRAWAERAPPFRPPAAPPAPTAQVVSLDAARARRRRVAFQALSGLAAAAALLIVVRTGPDDGVRTKGPGIAVTLSQARDGVAVDVFAGDAVDPGVPVVARARVAAGVNVAVVIGDRVVARGVADGRGVVELPFHMSHAGDVKVVACDRALADVVAGDDLAGCGADVFVLAVRP
jgi:anti-sigma factor RsiW